LSADIEQLIPDLRPYARDLVAAAGAAGFIPQITSTLRSRTQQTRLYRDYLRGGRGFPVAPPGTSAHEYGYAFDMVTSPMEALWECGQYWKQLGGLWGPGDAVHFEYPGFRQDFPALVPQEAGPIASLLDTAMEILNSPVGWLLPTVLMVKPENQDMNEWAASVVTWWRNNF
jgi:D-alanyl-D-alanine carboxypeptidase